MRIAARSRNPGLQSLPGAIQGIGQCAELIGLRLEFVGVDANGVFHRTPLEAKTRK
jgi:hypothetical protein